MGAQRLNYSVYVLKSLKDGKHYVGLSHNVQERLLQHNAGKVRSTKTRTPFILLYSEQIGLLADARKTEKYYKSAAGKKFLGKLHLTKVRMKNY
jgi:putative endonuclease